MKLSRSTKLFFFSSIFLLTSGSSFSANLINLNEDKTIDSVDNINILVKLSSDYYFKSTKVVPLQNGIRKHKFIQYYLGVPIWGVSLSATQLVSGKYNHIWQPPY